MGRMVPETGDPEIRERIVAPYRVLYHLGEDILILAIIHGRRDLKRALGLSSDPESVGDV